MQMIRFWSISLLVWARFVGSLIIRSLIDESILSLNYSNSLMDVYLDFQAEKPKLVSPAYTLPTLAYGYTTNKNTTKEG